ncbi:MAG: metal ABC transporter permease, partial [Verrucomicrobia bacterium]|nr:metal ABC transporter permease [Verrucomicrobiota bacterium]
MNEFFQALCSNSLLLYAVLAGLIASVVGGIIGSYVVVKRISFISGSISHSVLAGIGIFLWLERVHDLHWVSPLQGAVLAGIVSALLIGWIHQRYRQREDSVIAAVWSVGMAIGVLFIS